MMKGMGIMFLVLILGLVVSSAWSSIPAVSTTAHSILDPSLGALMNLNVLVGFLIIIAAITLITTLAQKYTSDQVALKTIKEEQKIIQDEMKLVKDNPQKQLELSKKSMELGMKTMPLTMKPALFTLVPIIIFFRWFNDYFTLVNYKFFGFITWFWFYLILSFILMPIFRKLFKVH